MAQVTRTYLVDDLDGSEGSETVLLALDGANFEMIREWAEQAGLQVSARGRIATTVQDAFDAAH